MLTTHWTSQTVTASCLSSVSPPSRALLCMLRPGNSLLSTSPPLKPIFRPNSSLPHNSPPTSSITFSKNKWISMPMPPKVSNRPPSPWFSSIRAQLLETKRERRRAERQWIKSGLFVHTSCQQTCQHYCASSQNTASKFLQGYTSRQLFSITNSLLGKVKSSPLPSSIPLSELPQRCSDFFHSKVTDIRRNPDSATLTQPSVPNQPFCATVLG